MRIAVVLFVVLFGLALSASAFADGPIHDCSSGCTIITCDGTTCPVYNCNGGTCTEVGSYPDNQVKSADNDSDSMALYSGRSDGWNCGQNRCAIKMCGNGQCSVVGFDSGVSRLLGTLDDTDIVLESIADDFINPDSGK